MHRSTITSVLIFLFIFLPIPTFALTAVVSGSSSNLTVEYDEPTTNLDGTLLDDLSETYVTYDKGDGVEVECTRIAATAPTGGGHIKTTCSVPANRGEEFIVTLHAYAIDDVPNTSDPSLPASAEIDRNPPGQIK